MMEKNIIEHYSILMKKKKSNMLTSKRKSNDKRKKKGEERQMSVIISGISCHHTVARVDHFEIKALRSQRSISLKA